MKMEEKCLTMQNMSGSNSCMNTTTMKVWESTRRKLKILAAERGVPMTQLLDELVNKEKEKDDERSNV